MTREIRLKAPLAEKEYDLFSLRDGDIASDEENSVVRNEVDHTFPLEPQLPKPEQIVNYWITICQKADYQKALNPQSR